MTTKEIFEKLLPIYERALSEKWDYEKIIDNDIEFGLCSASRCICEQDLDITFTSNYLGYMCCSPCEIWKDDEDDESDFTPALQPRIDFMKNYIKNK